MSENLPAGDFVRIEWVDACACVRCGATNIPRDQARKHGFGLCELRPTTRVLWGMTPLPAPPPGAEG